MSHSFAALAEQALTGAWNPLDFDFAADKQAWSNMPPPEQLLLRRLLAELHAGERSVASELSPLAAALAKLGCRDAADFTAIHISEELRHEKFFATWFARVGISVDDVDLSEVPGGGPRIVDIIGQRFERLWNDHSLDALSQAVAVYHLATEGISAVVLFRILEDIVKQVPELSALREALTLLRRDEARHVAAGQLLAESMILQDGAFARKMTLDLRTLRGIAKGTSLFCFFPFHPGPIPFGLELGPYLKLAGDCLQMRTAALQKVA